MSQRVATIAAVATVALLFGIAVGAGAAGLFDAPGTAGYVGPEEPTDEPDLGTFDSPEEFRAYFEAAAQARSTRFSVSRGPPRQVTDDAAGDDGAVERDADGEDRGTPAPSQTPVDTPVEESAPAADTPVVDDGSASGDGGGGGETRHSETNVQEAALDEPDVLKTDGESVYYSGYRFQRAADETTVLDISEPADPELAATIPASGELLLIPESDTLVVFEEGRIWGYDVTDPADPQRLWDHPVGADLQTARLHDGSLYLVLVDRPERHGDPCPIEPLGGVDVPCSDVHRPDAVADADAVYTAARLDPTSGETVAETSVVGSARDSATYVSENAIYLSYTRSVDEYDLRIDYLTGPGAEHLDEGTLERVEALETMDISPEAKRVELRQIVSGYHASLDDGERRDVQRDLEAGMTEYVEERQRDLTKTGIVRVSLDGDLEATASGEVPGYPLNQWSMDEHEGHLRIATTVPGPHGVDSENDVYVLDGDLDVAGSVTGLGETERIYSVRFQGDEGHVVTFRRIDPFYTLDLSDPSNPEVEGELKIPGVSHYLHPLEDDLMLGVGEEDGRVKLSTFDVSDRSDPREIEARVLEGEHFTEANRNHNAFLHDERHGVFFLPGGEFSYVYSYEDGELEEEARVDVAGPGVRAMYVDDYLYVFGPEEVVVLDETTWEVEKRIDAR